VGVCLILVGAYNLRKSPETLNKLKSFRPSFQRRGGARASAAGRPGGLRIAAADEGTDGSAPGTPSPSAGWTRRGRAALLPLWDVSSRRH